MRIRLLWLALSFTMGCGAHYRHQTVGSARARVEDSHAPKTSVAVPVAASPHRHRLAYRIELPRALEVHYALECPGVHDEGIVGETWEAYRERRLAELERERAQQTDAAGAVAGALLGSIGARATVETPAGQGEVAAEVDGQAVGEAVAEHALPPVTLSPADTGAQTITRELEMPPPDAGQCVLSLWSERPEQDLREVTGTLTLTAIVDLDEEKRARVARVRGAALEIRGELSARLVEQGADPGLRARRRAEARMQAEAERRRRKEAAAQARYEREQIVRRAQREREEKQRLKLEARRRRLELALQARVELRAYLMALGADPDLRARLRVEARFRAENQRRLRLEVKRRRLELALAARGEIWAYLIALGAKPEHRRMQVEAEWRARAEQTRRQEEAWRQTREKLQRRGRAALDARADVILWLRGNGAVVRPPRPPALVETPPSSPSATAVWIAGEFQWSAGQWVWSPGRWAEPPASGAVWLAPAEVLIDGAIVVRPGGWVERTSGKRVEVRARSRPKRDAREPDQTRRHEQRR